MEILVDMITSVKEIVLVKVVSLEAEILEPVALRAIFNREVVHAAHLCRKRIKLLDQ